MEMSIIGSTCMPKIVNEELPVNPGLDVVLGCQSMNIGNAVFETFFIQDKRIVWFCKDFQNIPVHIPVHIPGCHKGNHFTDTGLYQPNQSVKRKVPG